MGSMAALMNLRNESFFSGNLAKADESVVTPASLKSLNSGP